MGLDLPPRTADDLARPTGAGPHRRTGPGLVPRRHLHWFRRSGDDPFSGATLYRCRCGEARSGF